MTEQGLTERQKKWFASVRESLQRDTGKAIEEWVAIARTCPHDKPRARTEWLRSEHGLGVNRAAYVLSEAFPDATSWDDADALRAALWSDPGSAAIMNAVEAAVNQLPEPHVLGWRKSFTGISRDVQFAAIRPLKGGKARLGLKLEPDASPRLTAPTRTESWSERLTAWLELGSASEVDDEVRRLLRAAWERG